MAESRRRDWRDPETRTEPSSAKPWQASDAAGDDAPGLPSKRSVKRFLAIIALIGIAVTIGVIILLLRPIRPACLIVVGSGYEQNLLLPHNIHGWNGGLRLLKNNDISEASDLGDQVRSFFSVFFEAPSKMRRVDTPFELGEQDWLSTWEKIIKEIDKGSEKENVVIYLSAHGYADDKDAYLLRNVADVQTPDAFLQSRIAFREVLDSLKKVKEPKKVVLLLDVCHVQSHWPIGMFQNDFAKRLEDVYAKDIADAGNVAVICSAGPGQQSWPSEELQTSMFAHFVAQALKGEGRNVNDRVNAGDLFELLKKNVNEWAKINRARAQTPILLPADPLPSTVELVRVTNNESGQKPETSKYNPSDLKKDWENWRDLKLQAAPHVYSPHFWRLYQETLLRYEQLMRAGDPTDQASKLKTNLGEIAVLIRKARTLDGALDSVGNSFPMPRVLGFRPKEELNESVLRNYLARQKDEDIKQRAESRKPFADKTQFEKQYWQTRLSRIVLTDQLAKDKFNGNRSREQLAQIAKDMDIAAQLSPEVHLVRMLSEVDPAMDKDVKKLALAVSVRMLAEEVALSMPPNNAPGELYAEVIFKRIKDAVKKADETRQKGEDLLFGEHSLHADRAEKELTAAKELYEDIRGRAQETRAALALRDELAADLPFLATWIAQLPAVDNPARPEKEIRDLHEKIALLGNQLADLTKKLDRLDTSLEEIKNLVKPMTKAIGDVREINHQISEKLSGQKGGLQKNWHAIAATLNAPPALAGDGAVALRINLLESLKKTAEDIAAVKNPKGHIEEEEATIDLQRKLVRALLKFHEEQTLGPDRNVDERIREFYLLQPKEIVREAAGDDAQVLQMAAQRCRVVPAAIAEHVKDKKGTRLNPVDGLRRLRTYHLLDWLAQRTLDDHWFDPEASNVTFYRPAAKAYLDAAASMLDAKSDLRKVNEEKKSKLADTGLVVSEVFNKYWTTELIFPVKWPVKADAGVPSGTPMTWLEIKKGSKKGAAWQLKEREPINPWAPVETAASFQLQSDNFVDNTDATVVFHAVYRGQHVRKEATIERPPPDIIVRHTLPPQKSGFAVRMEKALDYGAISIVIDTSGSMKYVHPWKDAKDTERNADPKLNERSRFNFALDAMKQVLEKIPNGTTISMITFVSDANNTWPEFLEKPQPWQKGATDDVITKLRRHSLENSSPIANAVEKGMYEGFPGVVSGRKLVLVLTDGFDNMSAVRRNLERNTEGVITKLRDANRNKPDVDVMVVGFLDQADKRPVLGNKTEFDVAKDQFEGVKNFTDKSGFFPQGKGAELGRTIEELILRPYVQVKQNNKAVPGFLYGRPVNYHADGTLEWKPALDPNTYDASILAGPRSGVDLKMPQGHNLFAILKRREDRTFFMERGILGQQKEIVEGNYLRDTKDGWLATMLENHKALASNKISQLITLEKTKLEEDIRQSHPGFTWLELDPVKGNRHEQTLEIANDWSLPAAAYTAKMRWPDDRTPKLTTWFWPEQRDRFLLNDNFLTRRKMKAPFEADNDTDVIESISWERALDRLVVRVRFPVQKPIAVALKDFPDAPTEHRYFLKAGRGTAYFYGLSSNLKEINVALVNVDAFKKEASRVEFAPEREYDGPKMFYRVGE